MEYRGSGRLVPLVVMTALLAGCGQPAASPEPAPTSVTTPTPTPTPSPTPTPPVASPSPSDPEPPAPTPITRIEVTLADGKAEPNGEKVEVAKGETVEFVVTSDRHDTLHIHGVDVEIPVEAGETVTEQVVLEKTGRFEVESHHPELLIVQLIVR